MSVFSEEKEPADKTKDRTEPGKVQEKRFTKAKKLGKGVCTLPYINDAPVYHQIQEQSKKGKRNGIRRHEIDKCPNPVPGIDMHVPSPHYNFIP